MKGLNLHIPHQWIDLTESQLIFVSSVLLKGKTRVEALTKCMLFFTGLKPIRWHKVFKPELINGWPAYWYFHKKHPKPFLLNAPEINAMAEQCAFVLDTEGEVHPLKRIRSARALDYRLYDATFEHFLMAQNYFEMYHSQRKEELLNCLCSILYKRRFKPFNSSLIIKDSAYYKRVSMLKKHTVYLWYAGFQNLVTKRCPTLMKKSGGGEKSSMREQINTMMRMVNGGDISKNKEILNAPMWDALYEMEAQAVEYNKQKNK